MFNLLHFAPTVMQTFRPTLQPNSIVLCLKDFLACCFFFFLEILKFVGLTSGWLLYNFGSEVVALHNVTVVHYPGCRTHILSLNLSGGRPRNSLMRKEARRSDMLFPSISTTTLYVFLISVSRQFCAKFRTFEVLFYNSSFRINLLLVTTNLFRKLTLSCHRFR